MKLVVISFGMLMVLMMGGFFVFLQMAPEPDLEKLLNDQAQDSTAGHQNIALSGEGADSLQALVDSLKQHLSSKQTMIDSLSKMTKVSSGTIETQKEQINKLETSIADREEQKTNAKELAKSFEAMKVKEMRPILENLDNKTVRKIYEDMSKRSRKKLLLALSKERAAQLTEGILTETLN